MSVDIVRVNNTIYSWNSCLQKVDNSPSTGIVEVSYEQKRERKIVYAGRKDGRPLGWTIGKYSAPTFTLKMLKDTAEAFTDYLTTQGKGSYGDAEFGYMLQIAEPVQGSRPLTISAPICVITGKKDSAAEGIDELVTEFELATLFFIENGKRLFSAQRVQ